MLFINGFSQKLGGKKKQERKKDLLLKPQKSGFFKHLSQN